MSDLTTIRPFPSEKLKIGFNCRLFHSRIPKFTGKVVWNEENQEWKREIVWVCKEGCDGKENTPSLNDDNKQSTD